MKLVLMRHGSANTVAEHDAMRMLDRKGEQQTRHQGEWFAREHLADAGRLVMVSSPFVRARQTASNVATALGYFEDIQILDAVIPDGDVNVAMHDLASISADTLIVCTHMPFVSTLYAALLGLPLSQGRGFSTAMMLGLDLEVPAVGMAVEQWVHEV